MRVIKIITTVTISTRPRHRSRHLVLETSRYKVFGSMSHMQLFLCTLLRSALTRCCVSHRSYEPLPAKMQRAKKGNTIENCRWYKASGSMEKRTHATPYRRSSACRKSLAQSLELNGKARTPSPTRARKLLQKTGKYSLQNTNKRVQPREP